MCAAAGSGRRLRPRLRQPAAITTTPVVRPSPRQAASPAASGSVGAAAAGFPPTGTQGARGCAVSVKGSPCPDQAILGITASAAPTPPSLPGSPPRVAVDGASMGEHPRSGTAPPSLPTRPEDPMASTLFDLSGRRALITGSARGIGLALAQGLAEAGASVVLNGRDAGRLEGAGSGSARARPRRLDLGLRRHPARRRGRRRCAAWRPMAPSTSSLTMPASSGAARSRSSGSRPGARSWVPTSTASSSWPGRWRRR